MHRSIQPLERAHRKFLIWARRELKGKFTYRRLLFNHRNKQELKWIRQHREERFSLPFECEESFFWSFEKFSVSRAFRSGLDPSMVFALSVNCQTSSTNLPKRSHEKYFY